MNTNKDALDAFEWLYRSYIQANNCSVANKAADAIRQALQTQAELVEALRIAHKALLNDDVPFQPMAIVSIEKALARAEGRE